MFSRRTLWARVSTDDRESGNHLAATCAPGPAGRHLNCPAAANLATECDRRGSDSRARSRRSERVASEAG
jgi:hypothetical protein